MARPLVCNDVSWTTSIPTEAGLRKPRQVNEASPRHTSGPISHRNFHLHPEEWQANNKQIRKSALEPNT